MAFNEDKHPKTGSKMEPYFILKLPVTMPAGSSLRFFPSTRLTGKTSRMDGQRCTAKRTARSWSILLQIHV